MKRKKGFYSISAVARMFSVHQQTIRLYEKEGLITPKRSDGNTRMFSEQDIDRLEEIIYLTHKMGVNLAGVEMVLHLQKKIAKLQEEMNKLFEQTQGALTEESENYKKEIKDHVRHLATLKQESSIPPIDVEVTIEKKTNKKEKSSESGILESALSQDNWEIEYDE